MKIVRGAMALLLLPAFSTFALQSQYPCNQKIVQAVTTDNENEIRICLSQKGVSYTQQQRQQPTPQIDILVPARQVNFEYTRYYQTLEVNNGKNTYRYEFVPETDIRKRLTGTVIINDVFVYYDTHPIGSFYLPKTTKHAITPKLSQYGLNNITQPKRK